MRQFPKKTIWPSGIKSIPKKIRSKAYWDKTYKKYKADHKVSFEGDVWYCHNNEYQLDKKACLNRVFRGLCPINSSKKCHVLNQWRLAMGDDLEQEIASIISDIVDNRSPSKPDEKVVLTPTLSATKEQLIEAKPVIRIKKAMKTSGITKLSEFVEAHKDKSAVELCQMALFAIKEGEVLPVPCQHDLKKFKMVIKTYRRRSKRGLKSKPPRKK